MIKTENYHNNNFDLLRVLLSITVVFYHIGTISKNDYLTYSPGYLAVNMFFVISGYLIVKSYMNGKNIKKYILSRFFRIYPAYFMVVVSLFFVGFYVNYETSHEFLVDGGIKYLFYNSIFLNFIQPTLPNLFENNFGVVNGSLWTIKIEVMFYCSVILFYYRVNSNWMFKFATILLFVVSIISHYIIVYLIENYQIHPSMKNQIFSLLSFFMVGAIFNIVKIPASNIYTFILSFILFNVIIDYEYLYFLEPLAVGVMVYYLAFNAKLFKWPTKKVGDLSYGIYLWHYPIIQILYKNGVYDLSYWLSVPLTIFVVTFSSFISWNLIEKKMINLSRTISSKSIL